jgi:protein involved in polysaccharide export with SLBB domain
MKNFACFSAVFSVGLACALLTGCGGDGNGSHPSSPGPAPMDAARTSSIRVGDKITVQLTGVPDGGFYNEKQVPASGDINLPYLTQPFHAAGHSPAELAAEITDAYKSQKIYTNPVVSVLPEQQYINVGGDVRSASNIVWRPDSTLMSTINACGGFTDYADRHAVRILRGQQVIVVDCIKAIQTPGADPAVYPGDQIYVPRTMF